MQLTFSQTEEIGHQLYEASVVNLENLKKQNKKQPNIINIIIVFIMSKCLCKVLF